MSDICDDTLPLEQHPEPSPYLLDISAGHLLRRAHQRYQSLFQEYAAGLGLTGPQFATLVRLAELGSATQNHLGRLAAMDSSTVQGVVRRLIDRGFIQTGSNPMDRRMRVLTITPEGERLLQEGQAAGQRANDTLMAMLTPAERDHLLELLQRLSDG
ncbi:MarR family winged helix-turn-helix transcriptional regulator [Roseococcus pinisoli]|uniref:Winged helix-turn-helix transcriptional regulator n=1 Tax=Roseococcus pinisoli TaxID=2835040 RepID=A0ABS5QIZ0_9PROT|nr:MarR family winged helix-turn-helix transcriptional regulator [Roseococcus pinisoli]MBS7813478.1 winged helix-turn-helix transcriptional regulator [Roseococcus pinisoli]